MADKTIRPTKRVLDPIDRVSEVLIELRVIAWMRKRRRARRTGLDVPAARPTNSGAGTEPFGGHRRGK